MATLQQLVNETYRLLGDNSDIEEFDETDVIRPKINSVLREYVTET